MLLVFLKVFILSGVLLLFSMNVTAETPVNNVEESQDKSVGQALRMFGPPWEPFLYEG